MDVYEPLTPAVGWPAEWTKRFLFKGREWVPVERFYSRLAAGEHGLDSISAGLALLEPPPAMLPPPPAGAAATAPLLPAPQAAAASKPAAVQRPTAGQQQEVADPVAGAAGAAAAAAPAQQQGGPRRRATFKVHLAYHGPAFTGWQWHPQVQNSVEQMARTALERLLHSRAAAAAGGGGAGAGSTHKGGDSRAGRQPTVALAVAGRTDRGVHALGQVFSFYTWDSSLTPQARPAGCRSIALRSPPGATPTGAPARPAPSAVQAMLQPGGPAPAHPF